MFTRRTATVTISAPESASCVATLQTALQDVAGVRAAAVALLASRADVKYDPAVLQDAAGELALLGQMTRSASVYADTEVRCRILEAGDFGRIADGSPNGSP